MCAAYGLTSESRRRKAEERRAQDRGLFDLLDEPETFDEKRVDEHFRLPGTLEAWLDEHDLEQPV